MLSPAGAKHLLVLGRDKQILRRRYATAQDDKVAGNHVAYGTSNAGLPTDLSIIARRIP
jgi:hypothetical protein